MNTWMKDTLADNTTLSHYGILSLLGAGGMGEGYPAEDTRLERTGALKLLPSEFTKDANFGASDCPSEVRHERDDVSG